MTVEQPHRIAGSRPAGLRASLQHSVVGMSNRVYREYRDQTGFGGDFLIYSDVKEETLASPVVFTY